MCAPKNQRREGRHTGLPLRQLHPFRHFGGRLGWGWPPRLLKKAAEDLVAEEAAAFREPKRLPVDLEEPVALQLIKRAVELVFRPRTEALRELADANAGVKTKTHHHGLGHLQPAIDSIDDVDDGDLRK